MTSPVLLVLSCARILLLIDVPPSVVVVVVIDMPPTVVVVIDVPSSVVGCRERSSSVKLTI